MDLSVFFAGTAGSVPSARRGLPALLLRAGGDRLLFGFGEGAQQPLLRSIGLRAGVAAPVSTSSWAAAWTASAQSPAVTCTRAPTVGGVCASPHPAELRPARIFSRISTLSMKLSTVTTMGTRPSTNSLDSARPTPEPCWTRTSSQPAAGTPIRL